MRRVGSEALVAPSQVLQQSDERFQYRADAGRSDVNNGRSRADDDFVPV